MLAVRTCPHEGRTFLQAVGELTIDTVAQARRELQSLLAGQPPVGLDLAGVVEIDTAGVQFLVWLQREAADRGDGAVLSNPSQAVVEWFDLLGVPRDFADPAPHSPGA